MLLYHYYHYHITGWSHMSVCLYHDTGGGRDMRDVIREYEWYYKGRSRRLLKFHVLITTYDDLIRLVGVFVKWICFFVFVLCLYINVGKLLGVYVYE